MTETARFVYRLGEPGTEAGILEAGGKAANLSRLIREGFSVPEGFFVSARAYRQATNSIEQRILAALSMSDSRGTTESAAASRAIGALILGVGLPHETELEIRAAYRALADGKNEDSPLLVAVRSSATAEDLPDLSFAGQQDSYLDVAGEERVLEAILGCWASLWTPRAIDYRRKAGLGEDLPSMAVVVQLMVRAESAGVMFTADPVGGSRSRLVVEAVRGLGDALVSGRATPEHYALSDDDAYDKNLPFVSANHGAAVSEIGGRANLAQPILSESEFLQLARLGRSVEERFGRPQDIEWARAKGCFFLLQSRPITSLYPLPEDGRPCSWLYSFGAWQGYLEPFTPLGREMMLGVVSGAARLFGLRVELSEQKAFREAGERLWVEFGTLLKWKLGRRFIGTFLDSIDPPGAAIVAAIEAEGGLPPASNGLPLKAVLGLARFFPRIGIRVLANLARPAAGRERLARRIEETAVTVAAELAAAKGGEGLARTILSLSERIAPTVLPVLLGGMVSSQVPFQLLLRLASKAGARDEVLELTRGLPHNVTTEMDLALWQTAEKIRGDSASFDACRCLDAEGLARAMLSGILPPIANDGLRDFIKRYGFRGTGEIDLGRPRWEEQPTTIAAAILSYLAVGEDASPESAFKRGAARAEEAARRIEEEARLTRGPFGAAVARFLTGRVRELGGLRESPKYGIMRILGELRSALVAEGSRLVERGRLQEAGDIFFLRTAEIAAADQGDIPGLIPQVAERKAARAREARRRRVPRLIAGDGRVWFDPPSKDTGEGKDSLRGSPVSPGVAEGRARIVFDPATAALRPGDILVCPATDPAWTPLFLAVEALVMEVGGEMTHGSVVAREYGIPAVVGVARATERIPEGSRIRVDGAIGLIQILERTVASRA